MSDQGQTFAAFVQRELEAERDRRKTFDTRGVAVVTTSGGLTTVLVAVGALVTTRTGFQLPPNTIGFLDLALGAFAFAGFCGLMTTVPWFYEVAHVDALRTMTTERWRTGEVRARSYVAQADVRTIESLRAANKRKGDWLLTGLIAQVLGLLALTVAVGVILASAS